MKKENLLPNWQCYHLSSLLSLPTQLIWVLEVVVRIPAALISSTKSRITTKKLANLPVFLFISQTIFSPRMTLSKTIIIAITRSTWMSPPIVTELIMPISHNTTKIIAIVVNIIFYQLVIFNLRYFQKHQLVQVSLLYLQYCLEFGFYVWLVVRIRRIEQPTQLLLILQG